ncbi:flagellin [uncultured Stenotrophomonas sp.]|uniref:flagellin n=1 Tax=uncultured Stenotrophomonas sp. TaxID=165438 RepID=UPI0025F64E85|nr:flagellin [uncultured Stenotrophomonas sp.]
MAQVINTNIMSLNAQRNLGTSGSSLATSIQRLSSGLRINSAKDDAAGLAISERFSTQIRGMDQAARNANDGISMAQTAEGALTEIGNNLQRIRELSVQSRNATNSPSDREALNAEVQLLKAEIQRVSEQTNFNGTKLLDGSFQAQSFQIGADQGQTIDIAQIANANIKDLGNWNRVDTAAAASAVAPTGTVTAGGTGEIDLTALAVDTTNGVAAFNIDINGTTVNVTATAYATDAATTQQAVATKVAGLINTATGGTVATAAAGKIALDNSDDGAKALSVKAAGSQFASVSVSGESVAFDAGTFTLAGKKGEVTINFGAAGSTAQRASDLVKAINNQSYNTGVSASLDKNGQLALSSSLGDFKVSGTAADVLKQTGLTTGDTAGGAVGSAWAGGAAATGFADLDISTTAGADNALNAMDAALSTINSARADLGAVQNRFTSVVANLNTSSENMSSARSRIRDTDYAKETAELTRTQILQQAGTAMLAQANQTSQNVLSLLR